MAKRRNQRQRRKGTTSRPVPAPAPSRRKPIQTPAPRFQRIGEMEFIVTNEPQPNPAVDRLPPRVWQRAQYLYADVGDGNAARIASELRELHLLYPEVPMFGNWRAHCLSLLGREAEALAVLRDVHARHPGYLFARTELARRATRSGDVAAVLALLGPGLCLPAAFPDRKVFHTTEFVAFTFAVGEFFVYQGDFDDAEEELQWLQKFLPPGHQAVRLLQDLLTPESRERLLGRLQGHHPDVSDLPERNPNRLATSGQLEFDFRHHHAKVA